MTASQHIEDQKSCPQQRKLSRLLLICKKTSLFLGHICFEFSRQKYDLFDSQWLSTFVKIWLFITFFLAPSQGYADKKVRHDRLELTRSTCPVNFGSKKFFEISEENLVIDSHLSSKAVENGLSLQLCEKETSRNPFLLALISGNKRIGSF